MAAKRVESQQTNVYRKDDSAQADAEAVFEFCGSRLDVVSQQKMKMIAR